MDRKDLKTIAAFLQKIGVTETHEGLQAVLDRIAEKWGYEEPVTMPDCEPDVARINRKNGSVILFIGDAKVAKNETPSNHDTVRRIRHYISIFARLLGTKRIQGGIIAIATDEKEAAEKWRGCLNNLAASYGLSNDAGGPDFSIKRVNESAFIVFW